MQHTSFNLDRCNIRTVIHCHEDMDMHVGVTTIQQYICMYAASFTAFATVFTNEFPPSNYTTHRSQAINFIESREDQRKG
jgi:hypothetical protein